MQKFFMQKYKILTPVKKYWYLGVLYIIVSFILTEILVIGSSILDNTTDRLLAGESLDVIPLLFPFLVLAFLGGIIAFLKSLSKNSFSISIQVEIRKMIMTKIVNIQYAYLDEEGTGALLNRLISDIYQIELMFAETLPEMVVGIVTVTAVGIYIGMQSASLLLVTILCYPILLWLSNKATINAGKITKVRLALYDALENTALDVLQGISVGRSYNLYELQKKRIFQVVDDILANEAIRTKISSVDIFTRYIVRWIPQLICYLFCLYEVSVGAVSIGGMLAYAMLLDRIARPMGDIPGYIFYMREYKISLERLQKVLEQEEEPSGNGDFPQTGDTVIELEHIGFHYTDGREILNDISIEVKKGKQVAFVGNSGGGKSTAMKVLCGFYYPHTGNYRIYGHDFKEWNLNALREKIGLVSQNVFLFPVSIAENVSYGKEGAAMSEIIEACKNAGIHDFIMSLPEGYDTLVGERGAKLSGGQKQRLSIARAFLKNAPVLLLDEPTSAVDVETEKEIQQALKKIAKGRTVITVAHRLSTIMDADVIYVFEQGKIAEQGTHTQLMECGGVYASLYQREMKRKMSERGKEMCQNGIQRYCTQ